MPDRRKSLTWRGAYRIAAPALLMICCLACTPEPEPIQFGRDQCHYCKMMISDPNFGAELVTDKGKVFKFDAVECLLHYQREEAEARYAYTLAVAYDTPGQLHEVQQLHYLISPALPSPMGANLSAYTDPSAARSMQGERGGELFDWASLQQYLHQQKPANTQ